MKSGRIIGLGGCASRYGTLAFKTSLLLVTLGASLALAQNREVASPLRFTEAPMPSTARPDAPKHCVPEGKRSRDASRCCSKAASGDTCCGGAGGSCALSGCCSGLGNTPYCHQGRCVECLPEGATFTDVGDCCSDGGTGDTCCGELGGSCAVSGCCSAARSNSICYQGRCVECLPDGAAGAFGNVDACCSRAATGDFCCGVAGGSCAMSGCCSGLGNMPYCYQGRCVECLPDGATTNDSGDCCSNSASGDTCCGVAGGSCALSGCCEFGVVELYCHEGTCVECLPDGATSNDFGACCSKATAGGICCGVEGGTCSNSGCCAEGARCDQGICKPPCLPEGYVSDDAGRCCSLATDGEVCCGELGGSCGISGCCGGATCCADTCQAPCPGGHPPDPVNCQCPDVCSGADGLLDPACPSDDGSITRICCGGVCCLSGDLCRDGVCVGDDCTRVGTQPGAQICPSGYACICRPPNGDLNPDGCVCCERGCPPGSSLSAHIDCQGGCGDCCSSCVISPSGSGLVCGE